MTSITRQIEAAIRSVLQDPELEVEPATRLDDVPGLDSMNHIAVMVEAECRFGIFLELDDIDWVRTVGDLARIIAAKCDKAC